VRECFDYFHPLHRHEGFPKYIPECPDFYPAIERFQRECNILIRKLLKLLGLSLKLEDPDYFLKCSSHLDKPEISSESDFRAIYYPSISRDLEIPVGSVRCGEHTDYEIITLLFQDAVGGLEVS
jgi:isopenicillin N synthase-like dioxygenase